MLSVQSHDMLIGRNLDISPGILSPKTGQPITNCNRRFLMVFISLIRMRSKRDIKMGRLCTPRGAVLGIVGGGVTFRFLNGAAILDENMLFWVRLYALVVVLKILLDFRL